MLKIFFDMDGVLCDFINGAYRFVGAEPGNPYPTREEFNSKLCEYVDTTDKFWNNISSDFWAGLEPIQEGIDLLEYLHFSGHVKEAFITVCTSPAGIQSVIGKSIWLSNHIKWMPRILFTDQKEEYASPGDILIDDRSHVLASWARAGGIPLLYRKGNIPCIKEVCSVKSRS